MAKKEEKTNVMRLLEKAQVQYNAHTYDHDDGVIDGVGVAHKLGQDSARVFKTLVTKGASGQYVVFCVPVQAELDLKKAAQQLGIHRNTLEYQVRKMNAVIGGQPDEQKRFMMMCTYKMLALPDAGVPEL